MGPDGIRRSIGNRPVRTFIPFGGAKRYADSQDSEPSTLVFDPRRTAIFLIGGDKTGNNRWYEEYVPLADAIYDRHLQELHGEYCG